MTRQVLSIGPYLQPAEGVGLPVVVERQQQIPRLVPSDERSPRHSVPLTQQTRIQTALDDVAINICKALFEWAVADSSTSNARNVIGCH